MRMEGRWNWARIIFSVSVELLGLSFCNVTKVIFQRSRVEIPPEIPEVRRELGFSS
jgi:hypothetical protein